MSLSILLQGGLGNQLLQICAASYVSEKYSCKVDYDLTFFNPILKSKFKRNIEVDFLFEKNQINKIKISTLFYRLLNQDSKKILIEKNLNDLIVNRVTKNTKLLAGYFHNIEYVDFTWLKIKERIYKKLQENEVDIDLNLKYGVIHFRGGDYLNNKKTRNFHGLTSPTYYSNAIDLIKSNSEINQIYVVTDSPEYAHSFFRKINPKIQVLSSSSIFRDLNIIANAHSVIMSNSSFSWWGAYLAEKKNNAKIVYPDPWFANTSPSPMYFFRSNWLKLPRTFS